MNRDNRLEEWFKDGENLIPDMIANRVERAKNGAPSCWPFFAERYFHREVWVECHFGVRVLGHKRERMGFLAVFKRGGDGELQQTGELAALNLGLQPIYENLGDGHECSVLVCVNKQVEYPKPVLLQVPFEELQVVTSLVWLKVLNQAPYLDRKVVPTLSLETLEAGRVVIDRELDLVG